MQPYVVKDVKYRDYKFTNKTYKSEGQNFSFFALQAISFIYVETESTDTPYKLRHGYIGGFTQNKRRKIQMKFSAIAYSEEERWELIKLVNKIFEPPYNPNFTDQRGYYPMEFTTVDGLTWNFNAKVISRPKDSEFQNNKTIDFEVELITEGGSCIYGKTLDTLSERNFYRGFPLPTPLGIGFDDYTATEITYNGVSTAYAKCRVEALQDNATMGSIQIISQRSDGTFTRLFFSLDMNLGDVLIIDPSNYVVTLNGLDITGDLELAFGNNFPILVPGVNPQKLIVDTGVYHETCKVDWEWRNTWC